MKKQYQYKLRAECKADIDKLTNKLMRASRGESITWAVTTDNMFPDCELVVSVSMALKDLKEIIASIVDGHVMLQTVAPIEKYTGKR